MKALFQPGNSVVLLTNGVEYFPELVAALETAQAEVYLETYIFEPDATGHAIAQALMRAARRGVVVRVIVDGFGSSRFVTHLMPPLREAGVAVLIYRPELYRLRLHSARLRRLHRKLVVIDGRTAFVGGINIVDDIAPPDFPIPRLDYAVRVEGPLLQTIHHSVRRLWEVVAWANFKRRMAVNIPSWHGEGSGGTVCAAFVVRDNVRHRRDIETAYLDALAHAQDEVLIANAYFLPGHAFRQALLAAARRGVRVTVLLQGRVEYRLLHYATQALYALLLQNGVRIFEYHDSFLHAKVAVVDRHWATVGSSNIDPFSLLLAREANVVVKDANFAGTLYAQLQRALSQGAQEVHAEAWHRRPLPWRVVNWLCYGLTRWLIGLAGYRGEH